MKTTENTAVLTQPEIARIIDATTDWLVGDLKDLETQLASVEDGQDLPDVLADHNDRYHLLTAISLNEWDDDAGNHIYQLAATVFAHLGDHGATLHQAASIESFLAYWDNNDCTSHEELLESFGIKAEVDEASADYIGPVKVWIKWHYHSTHLPKVEDGWMRDEDNGLITFDSVEDAREEIEEIEESSRGYRSETDPRGYYLLGYGEYAAPDYTISPA